MRHKTVLPVILTAAALALALSCASCSPADLPDGTTSGTEAATAADTGGDPAPEKKMYRITFATSGGSYIAPRSVEEGKKVPRIDPRREGYEFEGWYTPSGEKYDFSSSVTSDLLLVAYWRRTAGFYPSDTSSPVCTTASAALNVVWRDCGDEAGKRPDSVRGVLTAGGTGAPGTYYVKITANDAVWDGAAPPCGTLSRGEGNWTAKITGLDAGGEYTFRAEKPADGYSLLQSGTSAVMTVKGYRPSADATAALTTANGRLYDAAGNLIVLRGVVSVNPGYITFPTLVSVVSLKRLAGAGVNCLRLTVQLTANASGLGYITTAGKASGDAEKSKLLELVDTAVKNASSLGMYVIIDWGVLNENPNATFDPAAEFFGIMAERYGQNPRVLFEICNEPNDTWGGSNGEEHSVKRYEEKIIALIRETGSRNIIICAPNLSATALSAYSSSATPGDDPIDDPIDNRYAWNLAYTFHCYPYNYPWDEKGVTSYGWKLRDAVEAGLTVITTEMSPIKANLTDGRDETLFDLSETAKFVNFYLENDLGFCYFRYNYSSATAPLSQWILFLPGIEPSNAWDREDLTTCGKWFYDLLTSDGVIKAADFSAPRHR